MAFFRRVLVSAAPRGGVVAYPPTGAHGLAGLLALSPFLPRRLIFQILGYL